jgi:tRNA(Arg) A34 adenosine deaminase TadA
MLMAVPTLLGAHPSLAQSLPSEAAHSDLDATRMRALVDWTMLTMQTPNPVPYGAEIFDSRTGQSLARAANAVGPEHDPSAHGEVHAIRLACEKLQSPGLHGHTLYTTCEPCPMCMACCVWARVDRVVYGATIADAAHFGRQIMIPAREVAQRSGTSCTVDGPVERERCLTLFTHPAMKQVFSQWRAQQD